MLSSKTLKIDPKSSNIICRFSHTPITAVLMVSKDSLMFGPCVCQNSRTRSIRFRMRSMNSPKRGMPSSRRKLTKSLNTGSSCWPASALAFSNSAFKIRWLFASSSEVSAKSPVIISVSSISSLYVAVMRVASSISPRAVISPSSSAYWATAAAEVSIPNWRDTSDDPAKML